MNRRVIAAGIVIITAVLLVVRFRAEDKAHRASTATVKPGDAPGPIGSHGQSDSTRRSSRGRLPPGRPSARAAPSAVAAAEEAVPSWEGKHMADYTPEEREATGLTNEKLFSFAGGAHWRVLEATLAKVGDDALMNDIAVLTESYDEAAQPYAYDAVEENVAMERHLLLRARAALGDRPLEPDVRASLEYLEHHVTMWQTGEANKLVERKIERENDRAKRIALRARARSEPDGEAADDESR